MNLVQPSHQQISARALSSADVVINTENRADFLLHQRDFNIFFL